MQTTAITSSKEIAQIRGIDAVLGVQLLPRQSIRQRSNSLNNSTWVLVTRDESTASFSSSEAAENHAAYLTVAKNLLPMPVDYSDGDPTFSVVFDEVGIFDDATRPSRLEQLIGGDDVQTLPIPPNLPDPAVDLEDPAVLRRARVCIAKCAYDGHLKKDGTPMPACAETDAPVLVIDQTCDDPRISLGLADENSFRQMLITARRENPTAEILIAKQPDAAANPVRWHFTHGDLDENSRLVDDDIDPTELIEHAAKVYVVTAPLGFFALIHAKHVTCFGTPFYAGWGITDDRGEIPVRRRRKRSLEQVFAAAFFAYTRYIDPDLFEPCTIERIIDHVNLQKKWRARNAGLWFGYGITWWKRHYVRRFVASNLAEVRFFQNAHRIPRRRNSKSTALFVWGYRDNRKFRRTVEQLGYPVWRMEDGFLRSVGLGTDLTTPASLVLDRRGIYYDARQASDLENTLAHDEFDDELIERANALIASLIEAGVTKYNVGNATSTWLSDKATGKKTILVPGQVEGDASLKYGGQSIRSDTRLLEAVRGANPDAHIIYKPHPDVVSGNRKKESVPVDPNDFDTLVTDVCITTCLDAVDEIHTMTSLTGFEALLRGKSVTTYGMPFYAGWGLTTDHCHCPRRTRRLTLAQLVAGTLILYPRYVNPLTGQFTTPEMIVELLRRSRSGKHETRTTHRIWGRTLRTVHAFSAGVFKEIFYIASLSRPFHTRPLYRRTRSSFR